MFVLFPLTHPSLASTYRRFDTLTVVVVVVVDGYIITPFHPKCDMHILPYNMRRIHSAAPFYARRGCIYRILDPPETGKKKIITLRVPAEIFFHTFSMVSDNSRRRKLSTVARCKFQLCRDQQRPNSRSQFE